MACRDPKQRIEGSVTRLAPVEAEDVFIEIGLQVLAAQAVIDAERPSLHIREDAVNPGQHYMRGHFADDMRVVIDARRAWIGGPSVGFDRRAGRHVRRNEAMQRFGGKVGDFREANTPRDAIGDFDRAGDEHLALSAAAAAARHAARAKAPA